MKILFVVLVSMMSNVYADEWSNHVSNMNCINKRIEMVQELEMIGYKRDYDIGQIHQHPERFKSRAEFMAMHSAIVEAANKRTQQLVDQIKHHNNVCK